MITKYDVLLTSVTDTSSTSSVLRATNVAITVDYYVVVNYVELGYTTVSAAYDYCYSTLEEAVTDGSFNKYLNAAAYYYYATGLEGANSTYVNTTIWTTPDAVSSSSTGSSSTSSLQTGAIVGIVFAIVIVLVCVGVAVFYRFSSRGIDLSASPPVEEVKPAGASDDRSSHTMTINPIGEATASAPVMNKAKNDFGLRRESFGLSGIKKPVSAPENEEL